MATTWPLERNAAAFYGDPRADDFERKNIVYVKPPFRMTYDGKPLTKGVRVHRKCAESLSRVYAAIWEAYGRSQSALDATGFTKTAGGFVIRNKRGGRTLSMHSYGAAVDHDPENNARGDTSPAFANHPKIVRAFAAEGWEWGGDWSGRSCDGMHWQAVWTKAKPARVNGNPGGIALRAVGGIVPGSPIDPRGVPSPNLAPVVVTVKPPVPEWSKEQMAEMQTRLKSLGYDPGAIDGRFGTLTGRALAAFQLVNGLSEPIDRITAKTRDALMADTAKPMAVSSERATATPAEIAAKVPEASATRWAFLTNAGEKVVYVGTAAAAYFTDTVSKATDALPEPIRDAVRDIPPGVIWIGLGGLAIVSVLAALRAGRAVDSAYKRGRL